MNDYCVFSLRNRRFALPLAVVREVTEKLEPVPLPRSPDCLLGLVHVRGLIFPQIELCTFLGAAAPGEDPAGQHMIVETNDYRFIAPVDRMDVRKISDEKAEPHSESSLHPALDCTMQSGGEKIELIHPERLCCALERALRFTELSA